MTTNPIRHPASRWDRPVADSGAVAARPYTTRPSSSRSHDMLLMHESLARAQLAERQRDLAQTMRLARLASARRRERRTAPTRRRLLFTFATAR